MTLVLKLTDGQFCDLSKLVMNTHTGTHVDTPAHFIKDGKNLDGFPIERWILPAHVVEIKDTKLIQATELSTVAVKPGEALLFKTTNSTTGLVLSGEFSKVFVCLSHEAADFCVQKKVGLIGIDYGSVERPGNKLVHEKLLENEILLLEGINLKDVPSGKYTLFCLPLKLKGAEGAPARAILVSQEE